MDFQNFVKIDSNNIHSIVYYPGLGLYEVAVYVDEHDLIAAPGNGSWIALHCRFGSEYEARRAAFAFVANAQAEKEGRWPGLYRPEKPQLERGMA